MAMRLKNRDGFLLLDSLISVFVTCLVCISIYVTYNLIEKYENGYLDYQSESNENLEYIFNNLYECEMCLLDEPD